MPRPLRSVTRVTLAAVALATLHAAVPTSTAVAAEPSRLVLDEGHIDLFEVTYSAASDKLVLQIKDDTRIYTGPDAAPVYRDPEDVVVALPTERATIEVTEDFPQAYQDLIGPPGTVLYYTDEVQMDGVPWPGWSSERLPAQLDAAGITFENGSPPFFEQVETLDLDLAITGPGDVYTWMNGTEEPFALFIDTRTPEADTIEMPVGSHVHSSWGFTEPGTYVMEVTPSADKEGGGSVTGDTRTYRFVVGGPDVAAATTPRIAQAAGDVRVGTRLSIAPGRYEPADPLLDTTWFVDGAPVGYGDTYLVPARLRSGASTTGRRIHAVITARREGFTTTSVTTEAHTILRGTAPRVTTRPRLTGSPRVGKTLRASSGSWSPRPNAYAYTWLVDGTTVARGSARRLKVLARWEGKRISVHVTASRDGHRSGTYRTASTGKVTPRR